MNPVQLPRFSMLQCKDLVHIHFKQMWIERGRADTTGKQFYNILLELTEACMRPLKRHDARARIGHIVTQTIPLIQLGSLT